MYLNPITDKIEVVLGAPATTSQLSWNVSYHDITYLNVSLPRIGSAGTTNGTTPVAIIPINTSSSVTRQVVHINVYNSDTATKSVIIQKDIKGVKYVLLRYDLTVGDTLMWSLEDGWRLMSEYAGSGGIISLNSLAATIQGFSTGTAGTDFNINSFSSTHTFNLPAASATNTGKLTSGDWVTFNNKQNALLGTGIVKSTGGTITYLTDNTANWDTAYTNRITSLTTTGTSGAATLSSNTLNIPQYQGALTLTTSGTSGPATLIANTLNIPQYAGTTYTFSTGLTNAAGTVTANISTGIAGGQTIIGGTGASENLTISTTSNATKGKILFGTLSAYDEVNDRLGIGTTTPTGTVQATGTAAGAFYGQRYINGSGSANCTLGKARGTVSSPLIVQNADATGGFVFEGYDGASFIGTANFTGIIDGTPSAGVMPQAMRFVTGTTIANRTERMRIGSAGSVMIGTIVDAGYNLDINGTTRSVTSVETPIVRGSTSASGTLTLSSTSNATKGTILFGTSAYDEVNNRLGIGTTNPARTLTVVDNANGNRGIQNDSYGSFSALLSYRRANGTISSPTQILANDDIGFFGAIGYHSGGAFASAGSAAILFTAEENFTSTAWGGRITFGTIPNGSTTRSERLRIANSGNILIGTTTDAGYKLDINGTTRSVTSIESPIVRGNTTASGTLTLSSTSNATKGNIIFGSSTYFFDEVNNSLKLGNVLPPLDNIAFRVQVTSEASNANYVGTVFSNTAAESAGFNCAKYRGTAASPSAVQSGDRLGLYTVLGYDGSARQASSAILFSCDGAVSSGVMPGAIEFQTGTSSAGRTARLTISSSGNFTYFDGGNFILGTTTGTKIGTATNQKLGFWNAAPIVQPTTAVTSATRVGGGGTTLTDTDTFDGYTIAQVVKALRNVGLLA